MLLRVKRLEVNRTGDESRCHRRYRLTQRSWSSVQRISAWAFDNPWLSKSIRNFLVWPWNDDTTAKSQSRLWRTSYLLHDLHLRWFAVILLTKLRENKPCLQSGEDSTFSKNRYFRIRKKLTFDFWETTYLYKLDRRKIRKLLCIRS